MSPLARLTGDSAPKDEGVDASLLLWRSVSDEDLVDASELRSGE